MTIDKHTLALISVIGNCLSVLGALYLTYDLLGGDTDLYGPSQEESPNGALFGAGYGLAFGAVFGPACGVTHGITLIEIKGADS
jgi:hypothetical protein